MVDQDSDVLLEALRTGLRNAGELVFSLSAPIKVPLKIGDGYRQKPLVGDEEFMLDSIRIGARRQVIFIMTPTDSRVYTSAEFDEKVAFKAFPGFDDSDGLEKHACAWLGLPDVPWSVAKKQYVAETIASRKSAREVEETGKYSDNAKWGSF